jgi:3-hydroxyacyl-CoA dehydrogenase
MATTIAAASAAAGITTSIVGRTRERAAAAVTAATRAVDRMGIRGPLRPHPEFARPLLAPVTEVPEHADGIVEAVAEDLELKRRVLERARAAAPAAWIASTTSSLPLDSLAADIGLTHFAFPAEIVPVVEVSFPAGYAGRDRVIEWLCALGKQPVEVVSAPGYVVTRMLFAFAFEAMRLHAEWDIPAAAVDLAALAAGFPLGPLAIADAAGIDLTERIARGVLVPAHGSRFEPGEVLDRLLADGRLGRSSGHGFYRWRGGRPVIEADSTASASDADAVVERLRAAVVDEAELCVEEGIAGRPEIDLLAVGCARCFPADAIGPCASRELAGAQV